MKFFFQSTGGNLIDYKAVSNVSVIRDKNAWQVCLIAGDDTATLYSLSDKRNAYRLADLVNNSIRELKIVDDYFLEVLEE